MCQNFILTAYSKSKQWAILFFALMIPNQMYGWWENQLASYRAMPQHGESGVEPPGSSLGEGSEWWHVKWRMIYRYFPDQACSSAGSCGGCGQKIAVGYRYRTVVKKRVYVNDEPQWAYDRTLDYTIWLTQPGIGIYVPPARQGGSGGSTRRWYDQSNNATCSQCTNSSSGQRQNEPSGQAITGIELGRIPGNTHSIGSVRVQIDPGTTSAITLADAVLELDVGHAATLVREIADSNQTQFETPEIVVVATCTNSELSLKSFSRGLLTDPPLGQLYQIPTGTPTIAEVIFRRTTQGGLSAVEAVGIGAGQPFSSVYSSTLSSQLGPRVAETIIDDKSKYETSESPISGSNDYVVIKVNSELVSGQWKVVRREEFTRRVLAGEYGPIDVVIQHRLRADTASQTDLVTAFAYDELLMTGIGFNPSFGKVTSVTYPDGSWVKHEYDMQGRSWRTYKPWVDGPASPNTATPTNSWLSETVYPNVDTVVETTRILGVTTKATSITNGFDVMGNHFYATVTTAVTEPRMNSLGQVLMATSTTKQWGNRSFGDFVADFTVTPDGRRTIHNHDEELDTQADPQVLYLKSLAGADWQYVNASEVLTNTYQNGGTIPNKTTRDITVTDYRGVLARGRFVYTDSNLQPLEAWVYQYDSAGRKQSCKDINGNVVESWSYPTPGIIVHKDRNGIATTHVESSNGPSSGSNRQEFSATIDGVQHTIPQAISSTAKDYHESGQVSVRLLEVGDVVRTNKTFLDLAGRVLRTESHAGEVATHAQLPQVTTVTSLSGASSTTSKYLDGQTKQFGGNTTPGEIHSYQVNADGTITHTVQSGNAALGRVHQTIRTSSGTVLKTKYPNPALPPDLVESIHYTDAAGRTNKSVHPGMAPTYASFDPVTGEVIGSFIDMDGSGTLTAADPFTRTEEDFITRDGRLWQRTRTFTRGPAGRELVQTNLVAMGVGAKAEITINSDLSEIETTSTFDWITGVRTTTTKHRRPGTIAEVSSVNSTHHLGGFLVRSYDAASGEVTTYSYNGFGEQTSMTSSLRGTSTWDHDPLTGRLKSQTEPLTGLTTLDHYPPTHINFGKISKSTDAANQETLFTYYPNGALNTKVGPSVIQEEWTYTTYGEPATLKTWRSPTQPQTTTWQWNQATGKLTSKTDSLNHSTNYTYLPNGLVHTRTNARNTVTTYGYDQRGELTSTTYSDSTPAVLITREADGQIKTVSDATGLRTYTYGSQAIPGEWSEIAYQNVAANLLRNIKVARDADSRNRWGAVYVKGGGMPSTKTLLSFAPGTNEFTAARLGSYRATMNKVGSPGGHPKITTYHTVTSSGANSVLRLPGTRGFDANGRLTSVAWASPTATTHPLPQAGYLEFDHASRRKSVAVESGVWAYEYNEKGEVEGAALNPLQSAASALPGRDFGYAYDGLGNRLSSVESTMSSGYATTLYQHNDVNELESLTSPDPAREWVLGRAAANAVVTVKQSATSVGTPLVNAPMLPRNNGTGFAGEVSEAVTNGPAWRKVEVTASTGGVGTGGGTVKKTVSGWQYFGPKLESRPHDDDGNVLNDGRWTYGWDAENRLRSMETQAAAVAQGVLRQRLEFVYDFEGRRVRKVVKQWVSNQWKIMQDLRFIYQGWNLLAEFKVSGTYSTLRSYVWGPDISGRMEGAGGVGGLLFVRLHGSSISTLAPCYDGNGNVTAYFNLNTRQVVAKMEYDPFGRELTIDNGTIGQGSAVVPPFRFSTKYTDTETSLVYYGYRYYSPEVGRWLSRDPIEEQGGINVYCFLENQPLNSWDYLGLILVLSWVQDRCYRSRESRMVLPYLHMLGLNSKGRLTLLCQTSPQHSGLGMESLSATSVEPYYLPSRHFLEIHFSGTLMNSGSFILWIVTIEVEDPKFSVSAQVNWGLSEAAYTRSTL